MRKYKLGEPVWARMEGYPYWPGRVVTRDEVIVDKDEEEPEVGEDEALVEFFNDNKRFAAMNLRDLRPFLHKRYENINRDHSGMYARDLKVAVAEANDYVANMGLKKEDGRKGKKKEENGDEGEGTKKGVKKKRKKGEEEEEEDGELDVKRKKKRKKGEEEEEEEDGELDVKHKKKRKKEKSGERDRSTSVEKRRKRESRDDLEDSGDDLLITSKPDRDVQAKREPSPLNVEEKREPSLERNDEPKLRKRRSRRGGQTDDEDSEVRVLTNIKKRSRSKLEEKEEPVLVSKPTTAERGHRAKDEDDEDLNGDAHAKEEKEMAEVNYDMEEDGDSRMRESHGRGKRRRKDVKQEKRHKEKDKAAVDKVGHRDPAIVVKEAQDHMEEFAEVDLYDKLSHEEALKVLLAKDEEIRLYRVQLWRYRLDNIKDMSNDDLIQTPEELSASTKSAFETVASFIGTSDREADASVKSDEWKEKEQQAIEAIARLQRLQFDTKLFQNSKIANRVLKLARKTQSYSLELGRVLRDLIVQWVDMLDTEDVTKDRPSPHPQEEKEEPLQEDTPVKPDVEDVEMKPTEKAEPSEEVVKEEVLEEAEREDEGEADKETRAQDEAKEEEDIVPRETESDRERKEEEAAKQDEVVVKKEKADKLRRSDRREKREKREKRDRRDKREKRGKRERHEKKSRREEEDGEDTAERPEEKKAEKERAEKAEEEKAENEGGGKLVEVEAEKEDSEGPAEHASEKQAEEKGEKEDGKLEKPAVETEANKEKGVKEEEDRKKRKDEEGRKEAGKNEKEEKQAEATKEKEPKETSKEEPVVAKAFVARVVAPADTKSEDSKRETGNRVGTPPRDSAQQSKSPDARKVGSKTAVDSPSTSAKRKEERIKKFTRETCRKALLTVLSSYKKSQDDEEIVHMREKLADAVESGIRPRREDDDAGYYSKGRKATQSLQRAFAAVMLDGDPERLEKKLEACLSDSKEAPRFVTRLLEGEFDS